MPDQNADGDAWASFLLPKGVGIVALRSRDGCKTWKIASRDRYVSHAAKGVVVERSAEHVEVSFDGRKSWVRSPIGARDTTYSQLGVATAGAYFHASPAGSWLVMADGARRVSLAGLEPLDLAQAVSSFSDGQLYIYGVVNGAPAFYRLALAALAAQPVTK